MALKQTPAGAPVTEGKEARAGPMSEGPMMKRAKLLIIDTDQEMVRTGSLLLGRICNVPEGVAHVASLKEAKGLIDEHRPDIVLIGNMTDPAVPDAHLELLAHAKGLSQGTKVIRWTGLGDEERAQDAELTFDGRACRTSIETIMSIVGHFIESGGFGQTGKKAKLVVIDGDPENVSTGRMLFGRVCDIPEIPEPMSLEAAKTLVAEQKPDIILTGARIDSKVPDAHVELLAYARALDPQTKVVLWSGGLGSSVSEGITPRFDAAVSKTDVEGTLGAVERLGLLV